MAPENKQRTELFRLNIGAATVACRLSQTALQLQQHSTRLATQCSVEPRHKSNTAYSSSNILQLPTVTACWCLAVSAAALPEQT